jgi:succinate dehydrogenase / fumarate reductase cytochrome b subunit
MRVYRDRQGQWAWLLHRITGLGVLVFLCLHVVDTSMLLRGEDAYNHLIKNVYQAWWFQPMEIALGGALLYHAINGVRLILIDLWEDAIVYRRILLQSVVVLFVLTMSPLTALMIWPFIFPGTLR